MNLNSPEAVRPRSPRRVSLLLLLVGALLGSVVVLVAPGTPASAQSAPAAGVYVPLSPARILDTRNPGTGGPIAAQTSRDIQVTGLGGVPTTDVLAVAVTVAAFNNTSDGWGLMWQAGTTRPNPASNINYIPGRVVNNAITTKVSAAGKVSYYTLASTDITVDVVGYYRSSPGGGGYVALSQTRILNTSTTAGAKVAAGTTFDRKLRGVAGIPDSVAVTAVALNMSTFNQEAHGLSIVYPRGQARPDTSTMNYAPWRIQTQLVLAKLSADGFSNFYVSTTTDVILDIVGYYTEGSGARFVPLPSTRVIDTRYNIPGWGKGPITQPLAPGTDTAIKLTGMAGVPETGVSAVLVNAIADTVGSATGFLTFWATGDARPDTNNLTYYANEDKSNLVIAKVGADGKAIVTNSYGTTALALDVVGYFATEPLRSTSAPLAVGPTHALSVKTDGHVAAWGKNTYGQLGNGTLTDKTNQAGEVPGFGAEPGNMGKAVSVAVGDGFSVALLEDGTVKAWGRNNLGQIGDGWLNDTAEEPWVTGPVDVVATEGTSAIAAGCTHALALGSDGNVWAWGDNSSGQLGVPGGGVSPLRVHVPGLISIRAVDGGCGWSMALDSSGRVWTWGANTRGQLGDGTTTSRPTPALVPNLTGVTAIGAGDFHALAVLADGTVRSWGSNDSGQLGKNSIGGFATTPVTVIATSGTGPLGGATAVAGGGSHSVANTSAGVVAWGLNGNSQLGNASTFTNPRPVAVLTPGVNGSVPLTQVVAIAAGGNSTAAVPAGGGPVRQAGNHFDNQNCETALEIPGTTTSTSPLPGPMPTSRAPDPKCERQQPGGPAVYGLLDSMGRATSAVRVLNATSVRPSAGRPRVDFDPVGFISGNGQDRSHLLAYIFGGSSTRAEAAETNIVALFSEANQYPTGMRRYERAVQQRLVEKCEPITYRVTVTPPSSCVPDTISCAPESVTIDADDGLGYHLNCTIPNQRDPNPPPPCPLPI